MITSTDQNGGPPPTPPDDASTGLRKAMRKLGVQSRADLIQLASPLTPPPAQHRSDGD